VRRRALDLTFSALLREQSEAELSRARQHRLAAGSSATAADAAAAAAAAAAAGGGALVVATKSQRGGSTSSSTAAHMPLVPWGGGGGGGGAAAAAAAAGGGGGWGGSDSPPAGGGAHSRVAAVFGRGGGGGSSRGAGGGLTAALTGPDYSSWEGLWGSFGSMAPRRMLPLLQVRCVVCVGACGCAGTPHAHTVPLSCVTSCQHLTCCVALPAPRVLPLCALPVPCMAHSLR
jgi:hypothetical protein